MTSAPAGALPAAPRLLSGKFTAWLAAATVSSVGDGILYFAIAWTAAGLGGQTAGLVLTLIVAPRTVLMLAGGALGDRWGLRRTVIGCDACMVAALGAYLLALNLSVSSVVLLAALALTTGVLSAFRLPASGAFPRLFVDDAALPRAMSMTGSLLQVARLAGPPLGGVVVAALGMTGAVAANLVSFALILAVLLVIKPPYERRAVAQRTSTLHQIGEGLAAARRVPGVASLLGAVALMAGSVIGTLSLCVPLAARERGWSPTATGVVEASWVVGTLTVTLVVAKVGTRARPLTALTVGPALAGPGVLVIAASPAPPAAVGGAFVMGVGTAAFTTHVFPLYVLQTPAGMLARFQALLGVVQAGAMLVANNVLGALASAGGPGRAMALAAGVCVLAAVVLLCSRAVRAARTVPALA